MKLAETKVLRDPIHGYIHIDQKVIWDLIDSKEFQRLRRIHQLGGVSMVYHCAEHTRFAHSLGVYELARRMMSEVDEIAQFLNHQQKMAGLCAALLHDLGHGPFSHCFERFSHIHHETLTKAMILDPHSEVYQILNKEDPSLAQRVVDILNHQSDCPLLEEMISSQLDCDRMDYLLRDAYMTGTTYGNFDLERILRVLRVKEGHLCVKRSGTHAVEDYIMARYQMYWQVYLHPDAAGYESMILTFLQAFKDYCDKHPSDLLQCKIVDLHQDVLNLQAFERLDDFSLLMQIEKAQDLEDEVLSNLSRAILSRRLPDWKSCQNKEEGEQWIAHLKLSHPFQQALCQVMRMEAGEYRPYFESLHNPIRILDGDTCIPLSQCSDVTQALLNMKNPQQWRVYFPKERFLKYEKTA